MVEPAYHGPASPPIVVAQTIEISNVALNDIPAGIALARFDVVFLDGAFARLADASNLALMPALGLSDDAPASGITGDIFVQGIVSNSAWAFTSGGLVFVASGGGLTQTVPSASGHIVQQMGIALTQTSMHLKPAVMTTRILS